MLTKCHVPCQSILGLLKVSTQTSTSWVACVTYPGKVSGLVGFWARLLTHWESSEQSPTAGF